MTDDKNYFYYKTMRTKERIVCRSYRTYKYTVRMKVIQSIIMQTFILLDDCMSELYEPIQISLT